MASRRQLNEEEILEALERDSDIEEDYENDAEDAVECVVEKIRPAESIVIARNDTGVENATEVEDDIEDIEDFEELELPEISEEAIAGVAAEWLNSSDILRENAISPEETPVIQCTKKKEIKWKTRMARTFKSDKIQFTAPPADGNTTERTPYSFFVKYLDDEFFVKAAYYTNIYATQKGDLNFKPCTADEIRVLIAQHIMMSCFKLPRVRMYYDRRWNLTFFSNSMTSNRFFSLRNRLHLTDISARPSGCKDRLFKVRPIIEQVRHRLQELPLEENLCVDEQIIPFKGKFMAKQYIKGKPCPWGIKVYFLCGKSGMPYDFIVYQGSTTPLDDIVVKTVGSGSAILELFVPIALQIHPCPTRIWYDNKVVNLASNFVGIGTADKARRWDKDSQGYIEVFRPEVVRLYNESMGGVDLLDQMIQYYRINIRTKKWTIRIIMHFIDLAITASWMEYRKHCQENKITKILDSLNFRAEVANCMLNVKTSNLQSDIETTRRRGRPSRMVASLSLQSTPKSHVQNLPESPNLSCCSSQAPNDSNTENTSTPPQKRKRTVQIHPPEEVRKDTVMHIPHFVASKNNGRCKMPGCTKKSYIICQKCNVYLCVKRDSNCFALYHEK
ncbi:piggyBac transposable element-derived protein 3-like [Rhagoletis pomonella]|uniref:piggyBac transposable element-derived protein 3-like n=1 Tax=Rhagoletis pomonella TaxID=28610 RepID=UPI0017823F34|nr:piggyBac transposable element-derived protein 3-like [Rhagoletis pomonella]